MQEHRQFLNQLVGQWSLTGKMGEIDLRQDVICRWILGGMFLWMYFKSTTPEGNPTSNYEAVYHIGFNEDDATYILHLLDTTEVPTDCVVGRAKLKANSLAFLFNYEDADFYNVFTWHPGEQKWLFQQSSEKDGEKKIFAVKEMVRSVANGS